MTIQRATIRRVRAQGLASLAALMLASTAAHADSPPYFGTSGPYVLGFEGISQYDGAAFGRNFFPPNTMGAVGGAQYMESSNGAFAVYNKSNGTRLSLTSDVTFWASAGQTGTNGNARVMYNASASRWVAVALGSDKKGLQIAVSDTDNALGAWKSVKF